MRVAKFSQVIPTPATSATEESWVIAPFAADIDLRQEARASENDAAASVGATRPSSTLGQNGCFNGLGVVSSLLRARYLEKCELIRRVASEGRNADVTTSAGNTGATFI